MSEQLIDREDAIRRAREAITDLAQATCNCPYETERELAAELEAVREAFQELREHAGANAPVTADEYAELLRAHTRAIWALKGEDEYPEDERRAMGQRAIAVLTRARRREGESA